jgi:thiazole synthase ThiGH ThiG subunit
MGYGSRALELLCDFYDGRLLNPDVAEDEKPVAVKNSFSHFFVTRALNFLAGHVGSARAAQVSPPPVGGATVG